MSAVELPLASKWAFAYQRRGPCRYFDLVRLYADGSFDSLPYASINLDFPIRLLKEQGSKERPSHLAQACDLFSEPDLYRVLAQIENHVVENALFEPEEGLLFIQRTEDKGDSRANITAIPFQEALGAHGLLRLAPGSRGDQPKPTGAITQ